MRPSTLASRRRLYLLARVVVQRHYRQQLTLARVARALATSPRELQRAFAEFDDEGFREHLISRRMRVAADLLLDQPALPVAQVARLAGYRQPAHFARAFRRRYGVPPSHFRQGAEEAPGRPQARAPLESLKEAAGKTDASLWPKSSPDLCAGRPWKSSVAALRRSSGIARR